MFSQFHPKATKNRSKGAFSFTLRENRLLEKGNSRSSYLVWLLDFSEQKTKLKAKPNVP
jgi:hypothetical protein